MSVPTLRRTFLAVALLLSAQALLADNPPAVTSTRMVYDQAVGNMILFGGTTATDAGTVTAISPTDTWLWNGLQWIKLFPAQSPTGRGSHVMAYDSNHARIVIFGGRQVNTDIDDTWMYSNGDWTQVTTSTAPSPRSLAGAAYDSVRDRVVLFGGAKTVINPDGTTTVTNYYDTWEFDGTSWTDVSDNGPQVLRPLLVYDEGRNQLLMMAEDVNFTPSMYVYDSSTHAWIKLAPPALPPCTNESALTYQRGSSTVLLVGGVCTSSATTEQAFSWDGTTWTAITTLITITRVSDQALAYDPARNVAVEFGGTQAFGSPTSATSILDPSVTDTTNMPPLYTANWIQPTLDDLVPAPRSLAATVSDPVNKVVYVLNGLTDVNGITLLNYWTDFWIYQNGGWQSFAVDASTPACGTPFAAFDTDRSKLVAVCNDGTTFEFDGTAWTAFTALKTLPPFRKWAGIAYDQTLRRTVLYGGYDDTNYLDTLWQWDGTSWTEQKNKRAPARALTSMWFDPILKKTVLYGGLGRPTPSDRLQRYEDMWSLDSSGWTEVKPATLPVLRYGAPVAVDPRNNHTLLFGGLRTDVEIVNGNPLQHQVYANDQWEWDGTTWTQDTMVTNSPTPRENASLAFDYSRNEFVLFGGWAGYYLGDTWLLDGETWTLIPSPTGRKRLGPR